jgi:hypothetical protein
MLLYRYNDPAKVPATKYYPAPRYGAERFRASTSTQSFPALIRSDGVAIFYCLRA